MNVFKYLGMSLTYQVFMLDASYCPNNYFNNSLPTTTVCVTWYQTCMIRQLPIVSDLQTNSQLFLQGLTGLKIRLYATVSPTTNDCDSYFIVWLSIVWTYIYWNPALRPPYIDKPIVCLANPPWVGTMSTSLGWEGNCRSGVALFFFWYACHLP